MKASNYRGTNPNFQLILCSLLLISVFWAEPAFQLSLSGLQFGWWLLGLLSLLERESFL